MKYSFGRLSRPSTGLALSVFSLCVLYMTFSDSVLPVVILSGGGAAARDGGGVVAAGADAAAAAAAASAAAGDSLLPHCVVNTCNDEWTATDGAHDANQDNAGCAAVRTMVRMKTIKANVTGHWCKVWRAVQMCEQRRYRYFIFRDDDTKIDVFPLLELARRSGAPLIASYKSDARRRVITNWFLLDTTSEPACAKMREWWDLAQIDHPEHDQKYFNMVLRCGRNGLLCINKRDGLLNEVHCRSSLGSWKDPRRQACLRYKTKMDQSLL